ncbi:unnamed protein product [Ilex paraguariensis]
MAVQSGANLLLAAASKDRTLRLWKFDAEDSVDHPSKIRAYKVLRGHNASMQSIAAQPSGDMVLAIITYSLVDNDYIHDVECVKIIFMHFPLFIKFSRCVLVLGTVELIYGRQMSLMQKVT